MNTTDDFLLKSDYYQINSAGNPSKLVFKPYEDQEVKGGAYGRVFKAQRCFSNNPPSNVALKLFINTYMNEPMKMDSMVLKQETKGIKAISEIIINHNSELDFIAKPQAPEPFLVKTDDGIECYAIDFSPWINENTLEKLIEEWNTNWYPNSKAPTERIQQACLIIESILDRFIVLHKYGIVHRDIHVGNLAFDETNLGLWVFDYSLTRSEFLLSEDGQSTTTGVGPIGFGGRSADWLRGQFQNEKLIVTPQQSDLYAIGNVADSLLCGELSPGSVNDVPETRIDRLLRLGIPVHLAWWVAKMTSLHISDLPRPESCEEALTLFHEVKSGRISPEFIPTSEDVQKWIDMWRTKPDDFKMRKAANEGREDVLFYLILIGVEVDAKNVALFEATAKGDVKMIDWLVTHGADVNAKNKDGRTAMHIAVDREKSESIKWLKENGADIDAKDTKEGFTPFLTAVRLDNIRIMACLKINGADINIKDNKNRTPMDIAKQYDCKKAIEWLKTHWKP